MCAFLRCSTLRAGNELGPHSFCCAKNTPGYNEFQTLDHTTVSKEIKFSKRGKREIVPNYIRGHWLVRAHRLHEESRILQLQVDKRGGKGSRLHCIVPLEMSEGAIQQKMVMNRADCRAITHMLDHKLPHYKQKFLCTVTKLEVQKGILDGMNRGRRPTRHSTADQRSQAICSSNPTHHR